MNNLPARAGRPSLSFLICIPTRIYFGPRMTHERPAVCRGLRLTSTLSAFYSWGCTRQGEKERGISRTERARGDRSAGRTTRISFGRYLQTKRDARLLEAMDSLSKGGVFGQTGTRPADLVLTARRQPGHLLRTFFQSACICRPSRTSASVFLCLGVA